MGYYMRFFTDDPAPSSIDHLKTLLQSRHAFWDLKVDSNSSRPRAVLSIRDDLLGVLELNQPGDGLFDEEIEELIEFIDHASEGDREKVKGFIRSASAAYVLQVLFQGREDAETFGALDVVWEVLFENHNGILQADGEGYYNESGQLLKVR